MKVFNRAVKLGGESRKINSITVRVLEYDLDGNVLRATGTSVPTGTGYAKGCLFIKTDAVTGTKGLYENQGTTSSASFNVVGSITEAEVAIADGKILVGNGSGVGAAVTMSGDVTITNAGVATIANGAVTGTKLGLGSVGTPLAHTLVADKAYSVYATQSSTDGGTSYEPVLFSTTLTGAGQVGGRVRAYMTTNVALGSWANALKGEVVFGNSGRVTGLASAIVAEMTMPGAALSTGNYAPLELELNLPSNFTTGAGTPTAFQFMSVQGAAKAQMDDAGYLFVLNGLTVNSGKLFQTNTAGAASHALRVLIGGTPYYIMLTSTGA